MKRIIIALFVLCISAHGASPARQRALDSRSFELKVAQGAISGYSTMGKFGVNLEVTTATDPEDVWEYGGEYVYDATNTAPIAYISSDNVADTNIIIKIQGLDIDGYEVIQTATITGQDVVTLDTPLWRVYRMQNISGSSLSGVVYCHIDPTPTAGVPGLASEVRAIINNGNNQTLMALYTIPRGKVGFMYRVEIGLEMSGVNAAALAEYAHCHYETRPYGKVFSVRKSVSCIVGGSPNYQDEKILRGSIPAMTDIRVRAVEVTADIGLWATFEIMLVDESELSVTFLKSIGQYGY